MQVTTLPKTTTLSNGMTLPLMGLGTFLGENLEESIKFAINLGYRVIDTAQFYKNEKIIGKVLQEVFTEGKIKRSELFITTKIWNNPSLDVYESLKESLVDLQLDYVDLCLLHWPCGVPNANKTIIDSKPLHIIWKEFERCHKEGLCKAIGVSNFNCQSLMNLLTFAEIKPTVNQIEVSPYLSQIDLITWCQKMKIHVTAFAPLCRGGRDVNLVLGDILDVFNEPVLKEIAEKHKKTIAQVVLNFLMTRGISVIPKSNKLDRIKENFNSDQFLLDEDDKKKIFGLNKGYRTVNPKKKEVEGFFLCYPVFD